MLRIPGVWEKKVAGENIFFLYEFNAGFLWILSSSKTIMLGLRKFSGTYELWNWEPGQGLWKTSVKKCWFVDVGRLAKELISGTWWLTVG